MTQNSTKAIILETLIEVGLLKEIPKDYEKVTDLIPDMTKELIKPVIE